MTVTANERRIQYEATAGQTVFPYPFPIQHESEITVIQTLASDGTSTTLTIATDYTVSGVGDASGGNITLVSGAALDDIITVVGATPTTRTTDFNQAGDYFADELNAQLDRITHILQENETETKRAFLLKDEDTATSVELPITSVRSSKYLAFDSSGDPIAADGTAESPTTAFMKTVLEAETAAAARTTLDAQEDVITTRGDLIRGSSSAAAERLALGTANQILTSDGTDANWSSDINVTDATVNGKFNTSVVSQTISSGAIAYTCGHIRLDTEGSAATDDLDTISGGTVGDRLVLRISSSTRNVVIKDGTGNIQLYDNKDILLDFTIDSIELIYDGANWLAIGRIDSDFAASFNTNGYTYLPNGLIFQWGVVNSPSSIGTVTLNLTYSTANRGVYLQARKNDGAFRYAFLTGTFSTSQFSFKIDDSGGSGASADNLYWQSIGY